MLLFSNNAGAQATTQDADNQSFKSVHGHEVLPQKGDCALGISATGFLNYIGNMMNNGTANNAPAFNSANGPQAFAIGNLGGVALMGKYMKTATTAYRVRFQLNAGNNTYSNNVLKSEITPDPLNPHYVQDKMSVNAFVALLGAGIEKRRGHGRVQGFYGAEALLGFSGKTTKYTYGNGFDASFTSPLSTTDFALGTTANQTVRLKESSTGTSFLLGVRAFTGVEYFFAPKMSLGGEIGYSLGFSTNGKGYMTSETWYSGTNVTANVTKDTYPNSGLMSWGIGLDNINAGINLHFYF
jgi:hypothetical protein